MSHFKYRRVEGEIRASADEGTCSVIYLPELELSFSVELELEI